MDIQAYINSGELELYVLDRLSPDERRRVEQYAEQYPEVRAELGEIERALEQYAVLQGQATAAPAPSVLDHALQRIRSEQAAPTTSSVARPATEASRSGGAAVWALAIALALALLGIAYLLVKSQAREDALRQSSTELLEARQQFTTLQDDCDSIQQRVEENRQQLAVLASVETRNVVLAGSPNAPESRAVVFYNPTSEQTLFSAVNLPAPPTGKQYQLWAIDGEGPQDLGVLDQNLTNDALLSVPYLPGVAAFAITLEDEGGKPTPDLSQLQVIGEVGP
ncbi:anti-sigma-K factor RskA [Lewinella aquimaris]|uniref:Anti-sigma-K factor RskA n=1 Tax=Neolewinella aquimaris TaxID=1835722 RepID=A0A840DYU0_9BACT|nr:anti-sigma factor [Neolewinella aquimaris]MBB4078151.1 anti-sigma-K factor RskA [Neolewinella aquimaris]